MNRALKLAEPTLGSLTRLEGTPMQGGEVIELIPREGNYPQERLTAQLEAENAALRQELFDARRALRQKDILLRNTRIRELELRAVMAELMG